MNTPAGSEHGFRGGERGERMNEAWEEWSLWQARSPRGPRQRLIADIKEVLSVEFDFASKEEDFLAGVRAFLDAQGDHVVRDFLVMEGEIPTPEEWASELEDAAREAAAGV